MSRERIDKVIAGEVPIWKKPRDINRNYAVWSLSLGDGYFIRARPSPRYEKLTLQLEHRIRARPKRPRPNQKDRRG